MDIDQTNYIQKVRRLEIDKVKAKYGGELIRIRIKGADDSSLWFTLWGEFDAETVERKPVEIVITELDEREPAPAPAPELVDEEPNI